ncbi:hypothetical protein LTR97_005497 [Elasticomyces elasticus]|uniref:MARVEL domain-containing protein n=1 Tax=Elasticomyces elasticus TaxID=574655 RepID=A0AAN7WKX9_9PEZI|nr:hypothetical protein LTR97_005497 [Elasticomyces elasticus]
MDPEKQAGPDSLYSSSAYDARMVEQQPQHRGKLVATKFLRGVQYVTLIVSLPFVCCAIDRNILAPGVTADEKALCASVVISLTILLYHMSFLHHSLVAGTLDAVAAVLLLATFVYFVCNSSSGKGVCGGPAQIGHWENHQGCERLGVATGFAGVAFGTFVASAILAFVS